MIKFDCVWFFNSGTLEILVDDINDNPPVFRLERYEAAILENAPNETLLIKITATDCDLQEQNKKIEYFIDEDVPFSINHDTGKLVTLFSYFSFIGDSRNIHNFYLWIA